MAEMAEEQAIHAVTAPSADGAFSSRFRRSVRPGTKSSASEWDGRKRSVQQVDLELMVINSSVGEVTDDSELFAEIPVDRLSCRDSRQSTRRTCRYTAEQLGPASYKRLSGVTMPEQYTGILARGDRSQVSYDSEEGASKANDPLFDGGEFVPASVRPPRAGRGAREPCREPCFPAAREDSNHSRANGTPRSSLASRARSSKDRYGSRDTSASNTETTLSCSYEGGYVAESTSTNTFGTFPSIATCMSLDENTEVRVSESKFDTGMEITDEDATSTEAGSPGSSTSSPLSPRRPAMAPSRPGRKIRIAPPVFMEGPPAN